MLPSLDGMAVSWGRLCSLHRQCGQTVVPTVAGRWEQCPMAVVLHCSRGGSGHDCQGRRCQQLVQSGTRRAGPHNKASDMLRLRNLSSTLVSFGRPYALSESSFYKPLTSS